VGIVGSAIFYVDRAHVSVFVESLFGLAILISTFFIIYQLTFSLDFPYGEIDWTVCPLQCEVGEKVAITVTNLNKKRNISFDEDEVLWEIKNEDGRTTGLKQAKKTKQESPLQISPNDSYTWLWDTSGVEEGIYRIHRAVVKPAYVKKLFGSHVTTFIDNNILFKKIPPDIKIHKDQIEQKALSRKITIVKTPNRPAHENRR
jgi:hypothetical protein